MEAKPDFEEFYFNKNKEMEPMKYTFISRDPIRPVFPGESPSFIGLKPLCPCVPHNSVRNSKFPGVFPSHKNKTFLKMRKKRMTFPQWEKTYTEVVQPSTTH
jgi:hypothetical protein